ncbi:flagellin [Lacrimispora indolis]|uniref:flagellin N-terminal helical domain-containing protein n=1 Tax=Lacrimispora indolis TaxID=69825 RepID=UPI0004063CC4|nr:flagellin [[Clostridium] methoxybenzovorans]
MRIQHNIAALNSYRQLGSNNSAVGKNLEKLSSGYRINRAGDDAAGLAISEKMRAQITGLETAQKNANDGISLIQTAEGALTEVHSMLNRMVELAGQSANGTYQNEVDRENLQKEVKSLTTEIDRISQGTNFNGINLLDGSMGKSSTALATAPQVGDSIGSTVVTKIAGMSLASGDTVSITAGTATNGAGAKTNEVVVTILKEDGSSKDIVIDLQKAVRKSDGSALGTGSLSAGDTGVIDLTEAGLGKIEFTSNGSDDAEDLATGLAGMFAGQATPNDPNVTGAGTGLTLQIGDTADDFNKLTVSVKSMSSKSLRIDGIDISTQSGASSAIELIKGAINTVSSTRGDLGALQNRLEHTINNLGVTSENMTAAESRIRDVDMAQEMMNYTKNNILVQSSQAMLAQANQLPQGVLQLLR